MAELPYRVMLLAPDKSELAPLVDAVQADFTLPRSAMGSISLAYPRSGEHHDYLASLVADSVDVPLRLYLDGQLCGEMSCYLESTSGADISSALEGEIVTFTGRTVAKELDDTPIDITPAEQPYLPLVPSNAAAILIPSIQRAQQKLGMLTNWIIDGNATQDANGVAWNQVVAVPDVGRGSQLALLDALVAAQACEYSVAELPDGRVRLRLFNWGGMTRSRPEVTFFAGRDMASASRQVGNTDRANSLILMSNDGAMRSVAEVPEAIARNGGRKRFVQKQFPYNVANQAALDSAASQMLGLILSATSVITLTAIEHTRGSDSFRPFLDYRLGDLVTNRTSTAAGFESVPVQAVALTITEAGAIQSGVQLGADYRRVKVKGAAAATALDADAYDDGYGSPYSGAGYDPNPGGGDGGGDGGVGSFKALGFASAMSELPDLTDVNTEEQTCSVEIACEPPAVGQGRLYVVRAMVTLDGLITSGDATALAFASITTTFGLTGLGIIAQGGPVLVEAAGPDHVSFSCSAAGRVSAYDGGFDESSSTFFATVTLANYKPNQGYSRPLATNLRVSALVTFSEEPFVTVS